MDDQSTDDWQWLRQADHTASRDFDKAVMTLAAGALALSIAFVRDLVPHPKVVGWLLAAWVMFAASLAVILVSFLTSMREQRHRMKGKRDEDLRGWTTWLNWFAAGSLVGGVVALVVFAFLNMEGR